MKFEADGVRSRTLLARLLVKMDEQPSISKKIGLTDTSYFRSEAGNQKKGDNKK